MDKITKLMADSSTSTHFVVLEKDSNNKRAYFQIARKSATEGDKYNSIFQIELDWPDKDRHSDEFVRELVRRNCYNFKYLHPDWGRPVVGEIRFEGYSLRVKSGGEEIPVVLFTFLIEGKVHSTYEYLPEQVFCKYE